MREAPLYIDINSGKVTTRDGKRCLILLADNFIEIGETLFGLFGGGAEKILMEMGRRGSKPYVKYWQSVFEKYNVSKEVTTIQLLCMIPRLSGYGKLIFQK